MDTSSMTAPHPVALSTMEHKGKVCLKVSVEPGLAFLLTPLVTDLSVSVIVFLSPCCAAPMMKIQNAGSKSYCSSCHQARGFIPTGITGYRVLGTNEWELGSLEPLEAYIAAGGFDLLTASLIANGLREVFLRLHHDPDFRNGNLDRLVEDWTGAEV